MTQVCPEGRPNTRARDYVLGSLAEDDVAGFEDHLVGCEPCTWLVQQIDAKLLRMAPDLLVVPGWLVAIWGGLEGTVLRPAPALGYLAAAMVFFALYAARGGGAASGVLASARLDAEVLDRAVVIRAGETFRGADAAGTAPVAIPLPEAPDTPVHLVLLADLDEVDLAGETFRVEIRDGRRIVWSGKVNGDRMGPEGLHLLIDREILPAETEREIAVVLERPGAPQDGQPVLRRTVRVGGARR